MTNQSYEGGPQYETFIIVGIIAASIWLRNIVVPLIFPSVDFSTSKKKIWFKFLIDFLIMLWPSLWSMTMAADILIPFTLTILTILIGFMLVTLVMHACSDHAVKWSEVSQMEVPEEYGVTTNVNYFRGVMLVLIAIAILAVDFSIFPSRFSKTGTYGHSVMDIGVAACVIGDGIGSRMSRALSSERRQKRKGSRSFFLSAKFILPLLGFLRTFVLQLIGYHTSEAEYGRHWNFFFTLGVVVIVTRSLPRDRPILLCLAFSVFTEILLRNGLEHRVLFEENRRENLIMANIEGLTSLPGYISLFYAAWAVADLIANTTMKEKTIAAWIRGSGKLFVLAFLFYVAQSICEIVLAPPSRRVANITYSLSQLSLLIFGFGVATLAQIWPIAIWMAGTPRFSQSSSPIRSLDPCLMETINREGLWFFLIANIFTGLVNMSMNTHSVKGLVAFHYLTVYLVSCCVIAQILQLLRRKSDLKRVSKSDAEDITKNGSVLNHHSTVI